MADVETTAEARAADPAYLRAVSRFGFSEVGPLEQLFDGLARMGVAAQAAPARAAFVFALAWVAPLALSVLTGEAWGPPESEPFLRDLSALTRLGVAAPLLILLDRRTDERLRVYLAQFADGPLIAPSAMPAAAAAVVQAIDRGRSRAAMTVCVALAFALSFAGLTLIDLGDRRAWLSADGGVLSPAGWWVACVSVPLFWFLLLRALWRYLCWALLLRRLAGLPLRLAVAHPDGVGGLAFLGSYPNAFALLVFAMGASMAGMVATAMHSGALSPEAYGALLSGWMAVVAAFFALPLSAFSAPLRRLKETALLRAAAQATRRCRAEERETLGENLSAAEDAESVEPGDVPDPSKLHAAAKKLGVLPFSRSAVAPLAAAALAPLLVAGASTLPLKELWVVARKLLLI